MADITKCTGDGCPLKLDCHRYTAKDNPIKQSYFVETPYNHKLNTCQMIWNDNAEWLYQELKRITKPTN